MDNTNDPLSAFERCPNEVLTRIQEFINTDEVSKKRTTLSLRLTSRRLHAFFTQYAVNTTGFAWGAGEASNNVLARFCLGKLIPEEPLVPAPAPDVFLPFISSVGTFFFFVDSASELQTLEAAHSIVEQLQLFWDELSRYRSLKCLYIHWTVRRFEGQCSIYPMVMDKLWRTVHQVTSGNGGLAQLSLYAPCEAQAVYPISQAVQSISSLQSLDIDVRCARDSGHRLDEPATPFLGDIVIHNLDLRSLSLRCHAPHPICKWEEIFPAQLDQLVVQKICIEGSLPDAPRPDDLQPKHPSASSPLLQPHRSFSPKLPYLMELSITPSIHRRSEDPINLDRLWVILKASGARLTTLTLRYGASNLLAEYLASYSGLSHWESNFQLPPTMLSASFLPKVLPSHTSSLISLSLIPELQFHRRWDTPNTLEWDGIAINPSTWPLPSTFTRLTILEIVAPPSWALTPERCQRILDYVTEMPRLQRFKIKWLLADDPPAGTGGANTANEYLDERIKNISENVFIRRCALTWLGIVVPININFRWWETVRWEISFPPTDTTTSGRLEEPLLSSEKSTDRIPGLEERYPLNRFRSIS